MPGRPFASEATVTGIEVGTRDGVRTIAFARPERRNGMDLAMFRAYYDALADADTDPDVRAVVVTGRGGSFCSGATPDLLTALTGADAQEALRTGLGHPPHLPLTVRKPLIAAINGSAAGLGLVHALYADVRFMAEGAQLSTVFSRFGLIAEYGAAWLLPRLIGVPNAMDLLLSARPVEAVEALRIGLVQRTAPRSEVLADAMEYARQLAENCSPASMAVMKRQIWGGLESDCAAAAAESVALLAVSFTRPDFPEAWAALRERR
jgi:enoyl-CoA hydratase/carnithine racemase